MVDQNTPSVFNTQSPLPALNFPVSYRDAILLAAGARETYQNNSRNHRRMVTPHDPVGSAGHMDIAGAHITFGQTYFGDHDRVYEVVGYEGDSWRVMIATDAASMGISTYLPDRRFEGDAAAFRAWYAQALHTGDLIEPEELSGSIFLIKVIVKHATQDDRDAVSRWLEVNARHPYFGHENTSYPLADGYMSIMLIEFADEEDALAFAEVAHSLSPGIIPDFHIGSSGLYGYDPKYLVPLFPTPLTSFTLREDESLEIGAMALPSPVSSVP